MPIKNRAGIRRIGKAVSRFTVDYCHRHRHPVNAVLHIVGVPAAFYGFYLLIAGMFRSSDRKNDIGTGVLLVFVGYLFQYLGHRSQGNEVGEVILLKKIGKRLSSGLDKSFSENGEGIWKMLGGSRARDISVKTGKVSNGHSNGHSNGNGNGKFTSQSLVWWKRS